jgi:hypothetical protein
MSWIDSIPLDKTGEPRMDDTQLEKLSLLELQDLQAQLHVAIRAAIRKQQEARAAGPNAVIKPAQSPSPSLDLARERDAWLARKRSGSSVA